MGKMLVVYYSWTNGNTKKIAEELAKAKHADIAAIDTVKPYTGSHNEVVNQALDETKRGYKPAIKPLGKNLADYETIAIGTPTWWYTMAPAVKTFLEDNDFSGKTVIPFMTNAGWPGHVIKDMTKTLKAQGANVIAPLVVKFDSNGGSQQETRQKEIDQWIKSIH